MNPKKDKRHRREIAYSYYVHPDDRPPRKAYVAMITWNWNGKEYDDDHEREFDAAEEAIAFASEQLSDGPQELWQVYRLTDGKILKSELWRNGVLVPETAEP